MNVSELIEEIGTKRNELNKMYSEYKKGMIELSELKQELQQSLIASGLQSAKSKNYGVAIVPKPKINVVSESAVKEWLENTPDIESDQYIGLKLTPFKQLATIWFKDTGEMIDGVEYATDEAITIRSNKKWLLMILTK